MTDELPQGWQTITLGEITTKVGSGATPRGGSQSYQQTGIPLIRSQNVRFEGFSSEGLVFLNRKQAEKLKEVTVQSGDVLLNITGASIGRVTQAPSEMAGARVNQHVCIIRLEDGFSSAFVARFLASPAVQSMIWTEQYGVTRQALTKGQILDFSIPVPPVEEQRRIVERLESLFAEVERCKERMAKIPVLLKRFRQSVLAAACSGRLTADWRANHPEGVRPRDNQHADIELDQITESPDSWNWLPLAALCDQSRTICYGVIKLGAEIDDGVPCLRTSDVRPLRIDSSGVKRISGDISEEFSRTVLRGGEVLVNVRGTLGGVAVVPESMRAWNISREVAMVPIVKENPDYIAFWIASLPAQNWLTSVVKGVAYSGINIEDLRKLPVALPSIEEQGEIVRRVKELLALADRVESRYEVAKKSIDSLTQSILAKAFRGGLVPTEAELAEREGRSYESAVQLLARIRSEKTTIDSPTKDRKKRRRTARV